MQLYQLSISLIFISIFSHEHYNELEAAMIAQFAATRNLLSSPSLPLSPSMNKLCLSPSVRDCYPNILNLITNYKKITINSPQTRREIKEICRFIKPLTECTSLDVLECIISSPSLAVYIADTFSELNYSYNQFCHDKDFQLAYLAHTPCYMKRVESICSPILDKFLKRLNDPTLIASLVQDQIIDEKDLIEQCCLLKNFLHCIGNNMIDKCGNNSVIITQVIWERLFTPLMNKHCSTYTVKWCPQASLPSSSSSSPPTSSSYPQITSSSHFIQLTNNIIPMINTYLIVILINQF